MNKKRIIAFGRGIMFKEKSEFVFRNFEIECFLDNSVTNIEIDNKTGVRVYNPELIAQLPEYDIYCFSEDWFHMWKQLVGSGVDDTRIKFGLTIPPYREGVEKIAFGNGEDLWSKDNVLYYKSEITGVQEVYDEFSMKSIARKIVSEKEKDLSSIINLKDNPVSRLFGSERGKAVDRYYIEKFLLTNARYIKGSVLEVLNNKYTLAFGGDKVTESVVSHVKGWGSNTVLCNFESGEGVEKNRYDCIICTQTLQYIFDLKSAMTNICAMLRKGGTALITVPGIKPLCEYDRNQWGEYWSFTPDSIKKLCESVNLETEVEIYQYGNVKTTTAFLYGICVEELSEEDFCYDDPQYPFIICAKIYKV